MGFGTLRAVLETLSGRRVMVVGDVILDEYLWGDTGRISPEAPVPVVELRRQTFSPGGAGNVAANVVSLGGTAILAGCVGRDAEGDRLRDALVQHHVDTSSLVVADDRPTTKKTRLLAHGQQIARMDSESRLPLAPAAEASLIRWIDRHLQAVDACILSDYGKGVLTVGVTEYLVACAQRLGLPVVVDPKGATYGKYRGATIIKPNVRELEAIFKEEIGEKELADVACRLVELLDGCAVLVTRGAEGMALFRKEIPPLHLAAATQNVFDVTGAGDTVVGVLGVALAAGATLEQAVSLANSAAGLAVAKRGTATVSLAELYRCVR